MTPEAAFFSTIFLLEQWTKGKEEQGEAKQDTSPPLPTWWPWSSGGTGEVL